MLSLRRPSVAAALAAGVLVTALAGCSGDDETSSGRPSGGGSDGGSATASGSASPSAPSGMSAEELNAKMLQSASAPAPLASANATVMLFPQLGAGNKVALTADVLQVRTVGSTTILRWRLRSTAGTPVSPVGNWLSGGTSSTNTRELALIDTAGKQRLQPFVTATGNADSSCICSSLPRSTDEQGVELYATFPALASGTQTVDLAIPQFPVIKGIAVTR